MVSNIIAEKSAKISAKRMKIIKKIIAIVEIWRDKKAI